jgi:hypothetical protein
MAAADQLCCVLPPVSRSAMCAMQSYGNNAEKYLRIGRQAMKLGNFVGK